MRHLERDPPGPAQAPGSGLVALETETPWYRFEATPDQWRREDPAFLVRLCEQLFLIRQFEDKVLELHASGLVHGPAHSSIGQEGGAVGAMSVLGTQDKINGTHRAHHQFLAKFLNYATPPRYDPRKEALTTGMRDVMRRSLAEIMGLRPGFCGGRGGSMHMRFDEAGVLGTNAIVGGNLPQAVGYAFADKHLGAGHVTVAFFGDGALQAGAAYESMNLAALYDLPVVFFLENNLYAVSTTVGESTRETRLASRGPALGIPTLEVDGMDVLAVRGAMQWALDRIRSDRGPVFIEAKTYRFFHQQGRTPGSAFGYRDKDEEESWLARDPVVKFPAKLVELGVIDLEGSRALAARAAEAVEEAAVGVTETEPASNRLRIVPSLWPDPAAVEAGIRGDLSELAGVSFREPGDFAAENLREVTFQDCIGAALLRNMERDERVVVIGEDIHRLKGGTFGGTRGVVDRFPDRVFATPIAENGFVGMALGASQNGLRPVIEVMYADFCLVAADQLFNQIAKVRHMFGGGHPVPLVVRSRVAAGAGYGSQHSMDASGLFALYAGWRIIAPATPFDYVGLMNTAVRCDDPVLLVEHQSLFQCKGPIPAGDLDYCIPFGKARLVRAGSACTVLAWSSMVATAVAAAERSGIDAEVLDLRTIDHLGLDWQAIDASVRRTNRVMVAEQTSRGTAVGARIVQELQRRNFDHLDHEVLWVTGAVAAPVVSKALEGAALAGVEDVIVGLQALVGSR